MTELIFIGALALIFTAIYTIAFKILPDEKWQVFASIPLRKTGENTWHGVNITFYGLLSSTGHILALSIFIIMMTAAGISSKSLIIISICICILGMFIPSAKIMAYLVERKKHTITVGGAVFVMIISAPWIISAVNGIPGLNPDSRTGEGMFLAALITAYSFGEGFGRLACISFGCCYGRPVSTMHPVFQKIFSKYNFVFTGKTKKVSYHDHLEGIEIVPVQAITAILYTLSGLSGLYLFFKGYYYSSFFLSLTITQVWRFASEFLRADYRGEGLISAYQIMSLFTIPYYIAYILIVGMSYSPGPMLLSGLKFIWSPEIIISLIVIWIGGVLYTGISSVTASTITIYVDESKI